MIKLLYNSGERKQGWPQAERAKLTHNGKPFTPSGSELKVSNIPVGLLQYSSAFCEWVNMTYLQVGSILGEFPVVIA